MVVMVVVVTIVVMVMMVVIVVVAAVPVIIAVVVVVVVVVALMMTTIIIMRLYVRKTGIVKTRLNHIELHVSPADSSLVVGWLDRKGRHLLQMRR